MEKRLYRSRKERMIAGICGGVAEYFGIDPVIVRIVALVLLFGGPGLPVYLILWLIVPEEPKAS
jgi:phage shock protein C